MNKIVSTLLVVLFLGIGLNVTAQEKMLTYEDASWMNYALFPERISGLQWLGETDYFSYNADGAVVKGKANSTKRDTILRLAELNDAMVKSSQKASKRIPSYRWADNNTIRFKKGESYFTYNLPEKSINLVNTIPAEAENIKLEKQTYAVAYTLGNNLFLNVNGEQKAITGIKNEDIQNGANDVHRNEFGVSDGIFWSPEGRKIAFYRMDESMVTDYPIVDTKTRTAEETPIKYPMAGMKSHQVTLGIYDLETEKTVFLKTGEPAEQYLTNITWAPDEKSIFIAVINREQNHLWYNQYNTTTGEKMATLFEETNPRYVEPVTPALFLPNSSTEFVWQSRRDGFNHLYLYNIKGELIKQITTGDWLVTGILGFTPNGDKIFYASTQESPLQTNLYSVEIKSGKTVRLSPQHGTHSGSVSYNGKYIIDHYSSTDVVSAISIQNAKGVVVQNLLNSSNPLESYNLGDMTIGKIEGENGDSLYYRMITPPDMDSTLKHPAIVYVYGGPHAQMITDSWLGGAGFHLNLLAQQGFIVFTVDNHGSANRGFEFESIIHRQVGEVEALDQKRGVDFLLSKPFVDRKRIGIDGWSYGGFMTINMQLKYPGTFKVGCAGGPVCDWNYYEIMYGERYMDMPQENEEGYKNSSVVNRVDQLQDKLMIIHGTSDPVVVWQHSLAFVEACIDAGVQVDYFVYPGHEHNVQGKDRAHLLEKISTYFEDYL